MCDACYRRSIRAGRRDRHPLRQQAAPVRLTELAKLGPNVCWPWSGYINPAGYGEARNGLAHRVAYELFVGPIPDGADIDFLCHFWDPTCTGGRTCLHRRCVNPAHLDPVTRQTNVDRGLGRARLKRITACRRAGHPYTPENTYVRPDGYRQCRECRRIARARAHSASSRP